ncbi:MAG: phosphoribosylglycinamide formyltransferase [Thermoplasmata archaeon]
MFRIGWFSTGRDPAARELLVEVQDRIQDETIAGQVSFVFSNRDDGEFKQSDLFFDLVRSYGIPLVQFSSSTFKPELRTEGRKDEGVLKQWRRQYDREVMKRLDGHEMDLGVLAGYMLIVGDEMCRVYDMINLHPAAPDGPKGTWQEVIWELLEKKAERTGVMMHLVTEELDRGPVITYCAYPIIGGDLDPLWRDFDARLETETVEDITRKDREGNPLFAEIRRRGFIRELPLIVHTLKEFAGGRIWIEDGKVVAEGQPVPGGYDLSEVIDQAVSV